jgi:vesicle transport protein SEC22
MVQVCFAARISDGLVLVESSWGNNFSPDLKNTAYEILRNAKYGWQLCSINGLGGFAFHYRIDDGVCYMVLCEQCYPKGLAFAFLDDVMTAFQEELKIEFGTYSVDYQSRIDTIEKPYHFIHFDRKIKKLKDEYKDSNSSKSLHRLNQSLYMVSGIMQQSIDDVLLRGDNLDTVTRKGDDLKIASRGFAGVAASLNANSHLRIFMGMTLLCILLIFSVKCLGFNFMHLVLCSACAIVVVAVVNAVRSSKSAAKSAALSMQPVWNLANEA